MHDLLFLDLLPDLEQYLLLDIVTESIGLGTCDAAHRCADHMAVFGDELFESANGFFVIHESCVPKEVCRRRMPDPRDPLQVHRLMS